MKKILNSKSSKEIALQTIKEVTDIVQTTLGPAGCPIILQQSGTEPDGTPKKPIVTKDGVNVAETIQFRDPAKETIARAIISVAQNTVNQAGDGTTTAMVLANAIFQEGYLQLKKGTNGIQLYTNLRQLKNQIFDEIDKVKKPINSDSILDVATISANGDNEIGAIVYKAIKAVGEDGHIALEDGFTRETTLHKVEGAVYKQGYRSFSPLGSNLVTDKSRDICELNEPAILLYAGKLQETHEFKDFMYELMSYDEEKQIFTNIFPLVIIAHDFSDEVKNLIVQSKVQAKMPVAAIKSPFDGSPNARTQMLEDLGVLVGGTVTARGIINLKDVTEEHLGSAKRIEIGAEETAIYEGYGDETEIIQRVEDLKKLMENKMAEFDKENIRLRIGKLTGGIAVIRVGGDSELEMKEKKDRIEDSLCASKVAITEGIIPGGGLTLYQISDYIEDNTVAGSIMKEALKAPIKQIIENTGQNPEVILSHMPKNKGYDAAQKKYCDLMKVGIIDPVKVTKSALENAVSIAGLLLTTGGAVVNDDEAKDGMTNPLAGM
jgi:chaperonin GroEL